MIEPAAKELFEKLKNEQNLEGLSTDSFCERAAYYLGEINALHPFREGNGRVQRIIISFLAHHNGYDFMWDATSQQEMITASANAFHGDYSLLAKILKRILIFENS